MGEFFSEERTKTRTMTEMEGKEADKLKGRWLIFCKYSSKKKEEGAKEEERDRNWAQTEARVTSGDKGRSTGIRGSPQSRLPELGWRLLCVEAEKMKHHLGLRPPCCFASVFRACELLCLWSAKTPPTPPIPSPTPSRPAAPSNVAPCTSCHLVSRCSSAHTNMAECFCHARL